MAGELRPDDPAKVGPYRLVRVLGGGGMGRVYLGQSAGGRRVAVKVIKPELADDREFRARFRHEVSAARKVSGLYTALVVDADVDGPVSWLATAYIDGPSLADAVERSGPFDLDRLLRLTAGLAEGLAAVHAAGVVHRDLKPSNVLLGPDGPVIVDFGISRAAETTTLTSAGVLIGTPGFMSPEQILDSSSAGPASDVFSLGAVLCYAATGRGPFAAGSLEGIVYRTVHGGPDLAGVPDSLLPLATRCLARDPARRPAAAEVLARVAVQEPVPARAGGRLPTAPGTSAAGVAAPLPPAASPVARQGPAEADRAPRASELPAPARRSRAAPRDRRRRRPAWLAAAVLAVAAAVTVPLLLAGPLTAPKVSAPPVSAPLRPPVTQAEARQVLAAYTTANNAANADKSQAKLSDIEGGSSLAIDLGVYREQQADHAAPYAAFGSVTTSYYIPLESPAAYPHWFAVQVKNVFRSRPSTVIGTEYLIFTQAAPGARWLQVLEPYLLSSAVAPKIALNSLGYATAVPGGEAGLAVSPAAASQATATALGKGTGQPANPGNLADFTQWADLRKALPADTSMTLVHVGTASPLFGLRTTDGGALLFYDLTARTTLIPPAGQMISLQVPGFFSASSPVTSAVIDYQEQFATYDPLGGLGLQVSVVADMSGITGKG